MVLSIKVCSGIYQIKNVVNGKVYVGCSRYIPTRWLYHRFYLNMHRHANWKLQKDWQEYGPDKFLFSLLEYEYRESHLLKREKYWINYFKDRQDIYNIQV